MTSAKGQGSVGRWHDHPTCPEAVDGVRPDHKCKGRYRAQTWVVNLKGKRTRKAVYGATEAEVVRKLRDLHTSSQLGTVVDTKMTVRAWLTTEGCDTLTGDVADDAVNNWWTVAAPMLKVNSRTTYAGVINNHLIPHLGHHRLDRLTPEHVENMYTKLRKQGLSEGSLVVVHHVLHRALKVAMRDHVARNVTELVDNKPKRVAATRTARASLTAKEAMRVLAAAGDEPRYWLALLAGMRQGECLGLQWGDLYLDDVPEGELPYLLVRRTLVRVTADGPILNSPKSDAGWRAVPLLPDVADRLRKARAAAVANGATPGDYLWTSRKGGPIDAKRDHKAYRALLDRAGVRRVTLASARNTCAQLLENAGVPDRVVAEILGHGNVIVTHGYQTGNTVAKQRGMLQLAAYLADGAKVA